MHASRTAGVSTIVAMSLLFAFSRGPRGQDDAVSVVRRGEWLRDQTLQEFEEARRKRNRLGCWRNSRPLPTDTSQSRALVSW